MRQLLRRRNGHSFETDAALARQPRGLSSQWIGKLNTSYHQATNWVTQWTTHRIRNWESQTSVSQRRRQVLLLFGAIGLVWVVRLIYLFYQLPALSTWLPAVGELTKETKLGHTKTKWRPSADSTHKADYLEARRGFARRNHAREMGQPRQLNTN